MATRRTVGPSTSLAARGRARCCRRSLGRPADRAPEVLEPADAMRAPELSVLSALAHGDSPNAVPIAFAALSAPAQLDEERALYRFRPGCSCSKRSRSRATCEATCSSSATGKQAQPA